MNDFELMKKAKNGDQNAEYQLYSRYTHLMYKEYRSLLRSSISKKYESKEEFMQEAYFPFKKALEYVKEAKITAPDTWKLYQYFKWNLQSMNKLERRRTNKKDYILEIPMTSVLVNINHESEEAVQYIDSIPSATISPEDFCIELETVQNFLPTLLPTERVVLSLMMDKKSSYVEYGKILKTSKQRVGQHITKMKKKWAQVKHN